jgi:hypothetical protein
MRAAGRRAGLLVAALMMAVALLGIVGNVIRMSRIAPPLEVFFLNARSVEARRAISIPFGIVPAAQLRDNAVTVKGRIGCSAGATVELRVTVTQGDVVARGGAILACNGRLQIWEITATTQDGALLASGSANVHVWSQTSDDGQITEWHRAARLVERR